MEKAGDYGEINATSRMGGSFGAWLPKTSSEASVIEACVIGEGVATENDVRMEVAKDMASTSGGVGVTNSPKQREN